MAHGSYSNYTRDLPDKFLHLTKSCLTNRRSSVHGNLIGLSCPFQDTHLDTYLRRPESPEKNQTLFTLTNFPSWGLIEFIYIDGFTIGSFVLKQFLVLLECFQLASTPNIRVRKVDSLLGGLMIDVPLSDITFFSEMKYRLSLDTYLWFWSPPFRSLGEVIACWHCVLSYFNWTSRYRYCLLIGDLWFRYICIWRC